jgi:hypothetical protein
VGVGAPYGARSAADYMVCAHLHMEHNLDGSFHLDWVPIEHVRTVTPLFHCALRGFHQDGMACDRLEIVDQSIFADRGLQYDLALDVGLSRLEGIDRVDLMQHETFRHA